MLLFISCCTQVLQNRLLRGSGHSAKSGILRGVCLEVGGHVHGYVCAAWFSYNFKSSFGCAWESNIFAVKAYPKVIIAKYFEIEHFCLVNLQQQKKKKITSPIICHYTCLNFYVCCLCCQFKRKLGRWLCFCRMWFQYLQYDTNKVQIVSICKLFLVFQEATMLSEYRWWMKPEVGLYSGFYSKCIHVVQQACFVKPHSMNRCKCIIIVFCYFTLLQLTHYELTLRSKSQPTGASCRLKQMLKFDPSLLWCRLSVAWFIKDLLFDY